MGVDSMTIGYRPAGVQSEYFGQVLLDSLAEECLLSTGFTLENVAADFTISRANHNAFAAASFRKAGEFAAEILPVKAKVMDSKTDNDLHRKTICGTTSDTL